MTAAAKKISYVDREGKNWTVSLEKCGQDVFVNAKVNTHLAKEYVSAYRTATSFLDYLRGQPLGTLTRDDLPDDVEELIGRVQNAVSTIAD
ncbi:MAG: hypothetical protein ACOH5I_26585 [Oligoflexus sp.]